MMEFTERHLAVIDALVGMRSPRCDGSATFSEFPHADVDLFNEELRESGFLTYAMHEEFLSRRPYERSLWVRREDGRSVPELYALATIKFGDVLPIPCSVYWTDRDATNTVTENVTVLAGPERTRPVSQYGVKSGTPEYFKAYRDDPKNRVRMRQHSRSYALKQRQLVQRAKNVVLDEKSAKDVLVEEILRKLGVQRPQEIDERLGDDDDRAFGKTGPKCLNCNDSGVVKVEDDDVQCPECHAEPYAVQVSKSNT